MRGISISNKNFFNITYVKIRNEADQIITVRREEDCVIITSNYVACPRVAYCRVGEDFIFDLADDDIREFVKEHYPDDYYKDVVEEPYSRFKPSVKKDYNMNHVEYIENWSEVRISFDGTFVKKDYPLKPYTVELKDAYDILHKLFVKYKKIVNRLIDNNQFIPTLTAGVDTRALSALWRDRKLDTYFSKVVKDDGKNQVELGEADYETAKAVAERIGLKNHVDTPSGFRTLSGMYTESVRNLYGLEVNDLRFIYKFIQHQIRGHFNIYIFTDDLFLTIKQPGPFVFRALILMILCPDLLDLPFVGTQGMWNRYKRPYYFYEEYKDYIDEAQSIIEYWGKEKVENILNEDY